MAWKPDYVALEEMRSYVRIPDGDEVDDVEIALAITGASRCVDGTCHRQFGKVDAPVARYYRPIYDRDLCAWVVEIDDLMSTVGAVFSYDSDGDRTYGTAITDYDLEPVNAAADLEPWTQLLVLSGAAATPSGSRSRSPFKAVAPWGWTAFPDDVVLATKMQANRLLARRNSPFGIAGSPEQGSELRLLERLDADVATVLRAGRVRHWGMR